MILSSTRNNDLVTFVRHIVNIIHIKTRVIEHWYFFGLHDIDRYILSVIIGAIEVRR